MIKKVAYIDFWAECSNTPVKYDEIHDINTWNNLSISRDLKRIDRGVGLFHVDNLEKIIGSKIIVTTPDDADVIICSGFGIQKYQHPKKKKIYISFEANFSVPDSFLSNENTLYFSSKLDRANNIFYMPIYICYYGFNLYDHLKSDRVKLSEEEFNSKNTCLSIISNNNGDFRNRFLDKLMCKLKVDNYGKYNHNKDNNIVQSSCWYDPRICDTIKKYKFMICMENTSKSFYHTEKIMHAFRNNIIPIYWGDLACRLIFNSNAYINVNELGEEKAIEKIIQLSNDLNEYNKMLQEPIFNKDSLLFNKDFVKYCSEDYFKEKIREIF